MKVELSAKLSNLQSSHTNVCFEKEQTHGIRPIVVFTKGIFRAIFDSSNKTALFILRRMYALYVKKQYGEDKN